MVDGCEKMNGERVAIVDLDGTLIRGNSLHMLIRYIAGELRRRRHYGLLAKLFVLLAMRRTKLVSHVAMKHPVHRLACRMLGSAGLEEFTGRIIGEVNVPLLEMLRRGGMHVIVASAAPSVYVGKVCERLGFDGYVATDFTTNLADYTEVRGERKRDLALSYAKRNGWSIALVVTDHDDDLPLLQLQGVSRLLVNPTPTLVSALKAASLSFRTMM